MSSVFLSEKQCDAFLKQSSPVFGMTKKPFPALLLFTKGKGFLVLCKCGFQIDKTDRICYYVVSEMTVPTCPERKTRMCLQHNTDYVLTCPFGLFLFFCLIKSDACVPCGDGAPTLWKRYRYAWCRCWHDRECPQAWQYLFRSRRTRGRRDAAGYAERLSTG